MSEKRTRRIEYRNQALAAEADAGLAYLGLPLVCRLAGARAVLLRGVSLQVPGGELPVRQLADSSFGAPPDGGWFVPPARSPAECRVWPPDGAGAGAPVSFFEQDVTGLTPLKTALVADLDAGRVAEAHALLAAACAAHEQYRDRLAHPADGDLVPLHLPTALAVAPDRRVVLLDAGWELRPAANVPPYQPPEATRYFPAAYIRPQLKCEWRLFDPLHARALYLLFRELDQGRADDIRAALAPTFRTFQEAEKKAKDRNQGLRLAEVQQLFLGRISEPAVPVAPVGPRAAAAPPVTPAKQPVAVVPPPPPEPEPDEPDETGSEPHHNEPVEPDQENPVWKKVALGLGVLCAALAGLALYLGLRDDKPKPAEVANEPQPQPAPGGGPQPAAGGAPAAPAYYVVLTRGAVPEQLEPGLKELFPGATIDRSTGDPDGTADLVEQRRTQTAAGLPKELFDTLKALDDKDVRFRGFNRDDADSVRAVIEREGVFTFRKPPADAVPGSLLQPAGRQKAVEAAGLAEPGHAKNLDALRDAILDVAAYQEALTTAGRRPALVVRAKKEPTPAALKEYEQTHQKIVGRFTQPLLTPRPTVAVYTAFDPKTTGGEFSAAFTLSLPVKSQWRLVGKEDRKDMTDPTYAKTSPKVKEQMKWQAFDAGKQIGWAPAGLRIRGQTRQVVSFDIAVPVAADRVVLFRNQVLYSDADRQAVQSQVTEYLTESLMVPKAQLTDGYEVSNQGGRFIATINYSALASALAGKAGGIDIQTLSTDEFQKLVKTEDAEVK